MWKKIFKTVANGIVNEVFNEYWKKQKIVHLQKFFSHPISDIEVIND